MLTRQWRVSIVAIMLFAPASSVRAGDSSTPVALVFDTELLSLNLTGPPVPLPIASDPGNALGDSIDGYGFVNSQISITLSSQRVPTPGPRSLGEACAFKHGPADAGPLAGGTSQTECDFFPAGPVDPATHDGENFFVQSFFDVFFDITAVDVDPRPGRDYPGGFPAVQFVDNGPANMQSIYNRIFDADAPNFGLIPPPEAAPYIGHFNIEIPLPVDINGNGELDKIKFTLATHAVGDENRTFIILPDGTVLDTFDSEAFMQGAVVDASTDPPFSFTLTGPTTASSNLQNEVIPEPSSFVIAGLGALIAGVTWFRRRK
jgi:hypothetical protein